MRSQGLQRWNRKKPQGRAMGSEVPREAQRMESGPNGDVLSPGPRRFTVAGVVA
jgi:hypothetical protein